MTNKSVSQERENGLLRVSKLFGGKLTYPWIQLDWEQEVCIDKIVLYDRQDEKTHTASGILHFSDGSHVSVWEIANDGKPKVVTFSAAENPVGSVLK